MEKPKESMAAILEKNLDATIHDWLEIVEQNEELAAVPLNHQDRTGHLPKLLQDVIARLRLDDYHRKANTASQEVSRATGWPCLSSNQGSCSSAEVEPLRKMWTP